MSHIPPIIYATAACAAGHLLGARAADIFDEETVITNARRARIVALCALQRAYPDTCLREHAACMGLDRRRAIELSNLWRSAASLWFHTADVEKVCEVLQRFTSGRPWLMEKSTNPAPTPAPPREVLATTFRPRKGRVAVLSAPTPLPRPTRRVSVTAAICGDPELQRSSLFQRAKEARP